MTVSLVGRMAMGRSRSLLPLLVTQATCRPEQLTQSINRTDTSLHK